MSGLLLAVGIVLLIIVSSDVIITTLTMQGGGFITKRFSSWVWSNALKIHEHSSNHRLLVRTGLIILSGMVVLWCLFTWVAWSLIFCSFQDAIINGSNKEPASILGRLYFTIYTLTTLGRGDYQPQTTFWHLLTGLASANGFFLVTLSIAYLFPVISALTQKRILASYISSLGGTADEILTNAWNGKDFGNLDQQLINLTPLIVGLAELHQAYPVLHYFHSRERSRCLTLSIVAFDEALTVLQYAIPKEIQPDAASLNPARRACASFLKTLKSAYLEPSDRDPPLAPLKILEKQGIPLMNASSFPQQIKHLTRRRKLLLALVKNDGWTWDAIASSETTSTS